jgi:lysophospholipid acyltransferase (LPLAT)-like uncharacterized protein
MQRLLLAIVPALAALLLRLLGATLRYEELTAPQAVIADMAVGPVIYAFWHRSLLIGAHRFRNLNIAILVSRSFDGELIARTLTRLGFRPIRGSSTRGGATALRQIAEAYRQGCGCAFTVDGPKGPAFVAKSGPIQLAELVGADRIATFHTRPDRAWVLNTWDRLLIPKPFSRVRVTWPTPVPATLPELQRGLDEAVRAAEQHPPSGYALFTRDQGAA